MLYPVWWAFPISGGSSIIGKINISRRYSDNESARPLELNRPHQAGLLLDVEGWDYGWGGCPHILHIINFQETYNGTVSHL
jgi:hypothetical protein